MGIASHVELARSAEAELVGQQLAKRVFVLTLTDNTLENNALSETEVLSTLGLGSWGVAHPTWTWLGLRKITINERYGDSPYHVECVAEYGPIAANELFAPTSRIEEWTFETKPNDVPALFYFDGSTKKPLTNSAYDIFEGLTTQEAMVRAVMRKNYSSFPAAQMNATNSVNSDTYFGTAPYTWKCTGVNTSYTLEVYNGVKYAFWATQIELLYRQTTHVLQIPDVGWNFLSGGEKRRAMVFDYKNAEWVASANPIGLDGNGGQTFGQPEILQRRVNPATAFTPLFGTPPS